MISITVKTTLLYVSLCIFLMASGQRAKCDGDECIVNNISFKGSLRFESSVSPDRVISGITLSKNQAQSVNDEL